METRSIVPRGENLRQAVRWMSGQGACTPALVESAAVRFDLSPLDEQFLLEHFVAPDGAADREPRPAPASGGYRDLAVHLDEGTACARRLAVAVAIARRFDAYLTGVTIERPEPVSFELGYSREVVAASNANREARREALRLLFHSHAGQASLTRELRVEHGGVVEVLARYALYRDLLVIGRSGPGGGQGNEEAVEVLTVAAGRPVVVVPPLTEVATVGRRVLIAWSERREAARAVAGAIPLLRAAEYVEILTLQRPTQPQPSLAAAELRAHLSRYDVKVTTRAARAADRKIGPALRERAAEIGADLVVMGAYGHARVRELVFGGATRDMLEHATVPLLVCH